MISIETIKEIIKSNEEFILKEIKNIIKRENIFFSSGARKVNTIFGVRRSGKTFLLYDLFKENSASSLYIDFEDERLKDISGQDLEKLKEGFFELKPHLLEKPRSVFLFLDEIQNVTGWEKFARRIVEREGINVYIAGSSSRITPSRVHSSLRGRAWSIEIYPFSFKEFLKTRNVDLENSIYGKNKVLIKNFLMEYLKWGGFPEISFSESDFAKAKTLKEYLDAMFFKDLVERFDITNILLLETLKENLFSSFSTKFSLTSFYKNYKDKFPFSKDSLFSYYKYFLESMLIFETRIFSDSAFKRMRNLPKIYLVDTGLSRKVRGSDYGRLLENAVFLELKRDGYDIYHFEENGECDFILKKEGNALRTIQVSWELVDNNRERELRGLIEACRFLKLSEGTIITYDQEETFSENNMIISVIPYWKWLSKKDL